MLESRREIHLHVAVKNAKLAFELKMRVYKKINTLKFSNFYLICFGLLSSGVLIMLLANV